MGQDRGAKAQELEEGWANVHLIRRKQRLMCKDPLIEVLEVVGEVGNEVPYDPYSSTQRPTNVVLWERKC